MDLLIGILLLLVVYFSIGALTMLMIYGSINFKEFIKFSLGGLLVIFGSGFIVWMAYVGFSKILMYFQ